MTDLRKAAEMALDALRLYVTMYPQMDKGYMVDARETLRQALAQGEPPFKLSDAGADTNIPLWGLEPKGSGMVALHQRQWVGLTDADLMKEFGYTDELLRDTAYRVEKILKELNK